MTYFVDNLSHHFLCEFISETSCGIMINIVWSIGLLPDGNNLNQCRLIIHYVIWHAIGANFILKNVFCKMLAIFPSQYVNMCFTVFAATCAFHPLPSSCHNGGYQDPANCARCQCPDGFGGAFCERLASPVNSKSHLCVSELVQHWCRHRIGNDSVSSHYLNQWWVTVGFATVHFNEIWIKNLKQISVETAKSGAFFRIQIISTCSPKRNGCYVQGIYCQKWNWRRHVCLNVPIWKCSVYEWKYWK